MTLSEISPLISIAALIISLLTAWFTLFRRGSIQSTHPSLIALKYDFVQGKLPQAKVFLRTLIFSTGKRGHVIESLSLIVREGNRKEEFSFWGLGDNTNSLTRGSGLFVPETGVVTNHHFNPVDSAKLFLFSGGRYDIELRAKVVAKEDLLSLWRISVDVPKGTFGEDIQGMVSSDSLFFNWSPEVSRYVSSIERHS